MKATVELTRRDLAAINLYMLPRAKTNWYFVAILFVVFFIAGWSATKCCTPHNVMVVALSALVGAIGGLLAGTVISLIFMSLIVGKKSGVLGVHHYTLSEQGLHEQTETNESLNKWSGIQSIIKTPNHILFQINSYLFHVLPRRHFQSSEAFAAFYEQAVKLRNAA